MEIGTARVRRAIVRALAALALLSCWIVFGTAFRHLVAGMKARDTAGPVLALPGALFGLTLVVGLVRLRRPWCRHCGWARWLLTVSP